MNFVTSFWMDKNSTMATSFIWFQLVGTDGHPFRGTDFDYVILASYADATDFCDAVKVKHANKLSSVDAPDLKVFRNRTSFDEAIEGYLEEDASVAGLGQTAEQAMIGKPDLLICKETNGAEIEYSFIESRSISDAPTPTGNEDLVSWWNAGLRLSK